MCRIHYHKPVTCNKAKDHVAAGVTQRPRPISGGLHPTLIPPPPNSHDEFEALE